MPALLLAVLLLAGPVLAQSTHHQGHSPYAGFDEREIKSLSADDVDQLRRGAGWGLALPAELNGVPGPVHLLELRDEIPLVAEQVGEIEALHEAMRQAAIPAGERLIEAERAIEQAFAAGDLGAERLRDLLGEAEAARAELRFIHLSSHLETLSILDDEQVARYNALRGYTASEAEVDPCDRVPEGHDPERYRRHMGCE
ncbi:MAG: Spy/CpxP family protein refolding chaperone [Halomonas sp.]